MKQNKYLAKLTSVANFLSAHFRIIVFMSFILFLSYIALLGIEIVSAIKQVPSMDDINKKMSNVSIRKDLIKKIDNFILIRRESKNSQAIKRNPFMPYPKGIENNSDSEPVSSPENPFGSPNATPSVSPNATPSMIPSTTPSVIPTVSPETHSTPGPDFAG